MPGAVSTPLVGMRGVDGGFNGAAQFGQVVSHGLPENLGVDIEIAMNHAVPHPVHEFPGDVGMPSSEVWCDACDVLGGLSKYANVFDDAVLD